MRARQLVAETLGTALLLAALVGSGIMAERLAGGSEGLALLCNSTATGAMLVVLVLVFGPVSGAHLNPAVTMAFLLRREISVGLAASYVLCQLLGAIAGTWVAHLMFAEPLFELSTKIRTGAGLWLAEAIATFGLVLTILGTLRWRPAAVPATVGLYIASAYWFTASTSFANPAVTIARSLSDTFTGIQPFDAPAFMVSQITGALLGAAFCGWMFGNLAPKSAPAE
jgi:glycerol uptake facilitator-like aquaporin